METPGMDPRECKLGSLSGELCVLLDQREV
jgi:hypothetical protein